MKLWEELFPHFHSYAKEDLILKSRNPFAIWSCLDHISARTLTHFDEFIILSIEKEALKEPQKQNRWRKLSEYIEKRYSSSLSSEILENRELLKNLFPYFSSKCQFEILLKSSTSNNFRILFDSVWTHADKKLKSDAYASWVKLGEETLYEEKQNPNPFKWTRFLAEKAVFFNTLIPQFKKELQVQILHEWFRSARVFPSLNEESMYSLSKSMILLSSDIWKAAAKDVFKNPESIKIDSLGERLALWKDRVDFTRIFEELFLYESSETEEKEIIALLRNSYGFSNKLSGRQVKDEVWERFFSILSRSFDPDRLLRLEEAMFFEALPVLFAHATDYHSWKKIGEQIKAILEQPTISLDQCRDRSIRLVLAFLSHMQTLKHKDLILNMAKAMSEGEIKEFHFYFSCLISTNNQSSTSEEFCEFFKVLNTLELPSKFVGICVSEALKHRLNHFSEDERRKLFSHVPKIAWKQVLEDKVHLKYDEILFLCNNYLSPQLIKSALIHLKIKTIVRHSRFDDSYKNLFKFFDDGEFIEWAISPQLFNSSSGTITISAQIVDFFRQFPWKLLLPSSNGVALGAWIKQLLNNKSAYSWEKYSALEEIEKLPKIPEGDYKDAGQQIEAFLKAAEEDELLDALAKYKKIPEQIQNLFLVPFEDASKIDTATLQLINFGQLLAVLMNPKTNANLIEAFRSGKIDLADNHFSDLINFATKLYMQLKDKKIDVSLIEKFLNSETSSMLNGQFADIEFEFKSERVRAHKALLKLSPDLEKYLSKASPIDMTDDKEAKKSEKIQSLISQIYRHYTVKDIPSMRFKIENNPFSLKTLFNNPEASPDFTISIGETKLQVHRTILYHYIPYFRATLDGKLKESLSSETTFPEEEVAIEYVVREIYGDINESDIEEESLPLYKAAKEYLGIKE